MKSPFIIALFVVFPATALPLFIVPLFTTLPTKLTLLVATDAPELIVVFPIELDPSPARIPFMVVVPFKFDVLFTVIVPALAPVDETLPFTLIPERVTP